MSRHQTARLAVAAAMLVTTLAGCVTVEQEMQQQVAAIPEAQRAYIAGSFRIACLARKEKCHAPFNSLSVFYRNKANAQQFGRLGVSEGGFGGNTVYDFVDPANAEKGIYFCQSLPAGDYSLHSYRYWNYDGGGNGYNLREEHQFDVPFRANAGEVLYVGDIRLTYEEGKSLLGLKMIVPGVVELSPGDAPDTQAALAKCAESVRGLPLRTAPLQAPAGGHPLVVVRP